MTPLRFALIGAAGYVAPRHMAAIKAIGGELIAAVDPHDSVGVIDRYFPECHFFTKIERFERHLDRLRRDGEGVDYVSICSPNYLHDAHCRLVLRNDAHAICEKPVAVNPRNLDLLLALEAETGKCIYPVHQLRLAPKLHEFKAALEAPRSVGTREGSLLYVTPRGRWYDWSWKGLETLSGGILANIGIHMLDVLSWLFGPHESVMLGEHTNRKASGAIIFKDTVIDFLLSLDKTDLPLSGSSHRMLSVNGVWELEFSGGFTGLHEEVYRNITDPQSAPYMRLSDLRPVTTLLADLRSQA